MNHLAVTIGDPAGIGTEVVLKALANVSLTENCEITLIGSRSILKLTYQHLLQQGISQDSLANPDSLNILDIPYDYDLTFGLGNRETGKASFQYLEKAIALTLEGKFQGIVTAPIAKSLWKQAGYNYPGQTEVLAQAANTERYGMLFVARSPYTGWMLRTLLATTHIPLSQVSQSLSPELMNLKLDLLIECLKADFGINNPKIVISGLNPHSGEAGQLGTEEIDWLFSWLETAQKNYPQAELIGLLPPDTMWVKPGQAWYGELKPKKSNIPAINNGADAYLALYHDQGLIPVKLMAFDRAINTTIGLPFIRTSPDHGTAFDIAGKGIADATSIEAAIALAREISKIRERE
ncbi:MAG: 4-hydroxythreonine-4-phosphate dehydrogenase PdxA [Xenococcaceae cyanobacterium MO_188.B19]|nr:4-hydroxythreonine-4-phosphate dehydrogenase PdxA [Xenococcaceae cyanobacterium MO_188.B19]